MKFELLDRDEGLSDRAFYEKKLGRLWLRGTLMDEPRYIIIDKDGDITIGASDLRLQPIRGIDTPVRIKKIILECV